MKFQTKYERELEDFSNFPDINRTRSITDLTIISTTLFVLLLTAILI